MPDDRAGLVAHLVVPLEDADQVLLQARTRRGVRERAVLAAVADLRRGFGDADEARRHDRVGGERPARRVHRHVGAEAERLDEQRLLVGERALDLGHLDRRLLQAAAFAASVVDGDDVRSRMPG